MKYIVTIRVTFALIFAPVFTLNAKKNIDSVSSYYKHKYAAELAIVDSNYAEALKLYEKAFTFKRPFEKDIYNSFILSNLLKNWDKSKLYFNQLAALGMNKSTLASDLYHMGLDTSEFRRISVDYELIRKRADNTFMPVNSRLMDSMYALDQGIRQVANNMYGPVEWPKEFNDSIIKADTTNLRLMLNFVRAKGFPDIYTTGFYAKNYIHISSYPMIFLLMRHIIGIPSSWPAKAEMLNFMKEAVLEGKYDPRDYAFMYDESEQSTYGSVFNVSVYEGKRLLEGIDEQTQQLIDQRRKRIYLDSVDDYRRKLEFMRRCYYFHFFNVFILMYNQVSYDPNSIQPK